MSTPKYKKKKEERIRSAFPRSKFFAYTPIECKTKQTYNITLLFRSFPSDFFQCAPLGNYFNNQKLFGWHFVPICFCYLFPDFSILSHFKCDSRTGPFKLFLLCAHAISVYRYRDCKNHGLRVQLLFSTSFFFSPVLDFNNWANVFFVYFWII